MPPMDEQASSESLIVLAALQTDGAGAWRACAAACRRSHHRFRRRCPADSGEELRPVPRAGRNKGGFSIESRETLLKGGDNGPAVVLGRSDESELVALVAGLDPENVMPQKGSRLTDQQIGILRAWIDQGASWAPG